MSSFLTKTPNSVQLELMELIRELDALVADPRLKGCLMSAKSLPKNQVSIITEINLIGEFIKTLETHFGIRKNFSNTQIDQSLLVVRFLVQKEVSTSSQRVASAQTAAGMNFIEIARFLRSYEPQRAHPPGYLYDLLGLSHPKAQL